MSFIILIIIGVEVLYHQFIVNRKLYKVGIWDAVGIEKYRAVNSSLYRKAHGALLLADISGKSWENNLDYWMKEFKEKAEPGAPIFLVGNKCDLPEDSGTLTRLIEYAEKYDIPFYKTSSRFGENVCSVMENLLSEINERFPEEVLRGRQSLGFDGISQRMSSGMRRFSPEQRGCFLNCSIKAKVN